MAYTNSGGDFITKRHSTSYDYISPLNLDYTGRNVMITGAASEDGVGFATALAYARAGASVVILTDLLDIASSSLEKVRDAGRSSSRTTSVLTSPLRVYGYQVDITSKESTKALYDTTSSILNGRLDVLVNNAACQEAPHPFLHFDDETYWKPYETNVRGLFNMARTFLPLLLSSPESGACTMINVASSGALSARANGGSYRTSKLAIIRWTETLQLEYGSQGLLSYCVNPGAIKTGMTEGMPEKIRDALPDRPDVAGDTIAWLTSERREWLGGRYVSCPWDMEELVGRKEEIVEKDLLKIRMSF